MERGELMKARGNLYEYVIIVVQFQNKSDRSRYPRRKHAQTYVRLSQTSYRLFLLKKGLFNVVADAHDKNTVG